MNGTPTTEGEHCSWIERPPPVATLVVRLVDRRYAALMAAAGAKHAQLNLVIGWLVAQGVREGRPAPTTGATAND
jgi:hypothetical protein